MSEGSSSLIFRVYDQQCNVICDVELERWMEKEMKKLDHHHHKHKVTILFVVFSLFYMSLAFKKSTYLGILSPLNTENSLRKIMIEKS